MKENELYQLYSCRMQWPGPKLEIALYLFNKSFNLSKQLIFKMDFFYLTSM